MLELRDRPWIFVGNSWMVGFYASFIRRLYRQVANFLEKYIPATYACDEVLDTDQFGKLPVSKAKGEGGRSDLPTRIGDNYYNQYLRYVNHLIFLQLGSFVVLAI